MINNLVELELWVGLLHPKPQLQKPNPFPNTTLKRNFLDCLVKQNIRCIAFKYFLRATYYYSIITMIPNRIKVILNLGSCGNQCKLPLLNHVIVQNDWNRYNGKALNNIGAVSDSPFKIDKSFHSNYGELSISRKKHAQQWLIAKMNSNYRKNNYFPKDVLVLSVCHKIHPKYRLKFA